MAETRVIAPDQLTVTFIHGDEPACRSYGEKVKTMAFLDKVLAEHGPEKIKDIIPPVTAILDPEGNRLLIYDGNKRTRHAKEKGYSLRVIILTSPEDLENYFRDHDVLWFKITDFDELLKFMRMYAQYPRENDPNIPEEWRRKIEEKHLEDQGQQEIDLFWPDDDE